MIVNLGKWNPACKIHEKAHILTLDLTCFDSQSFKVIILYKGMHLHWQPSALLVSSRGHGLPGCWCALGAFQWARFFLALQRLLSPEGILNSEPAVQFKPEEVKAA
ncbi:MATE efflux family protein [Salix suchowensis]|nr:MATE efflux family protein [Salix suchowensis]